MFQRLLVPTDPDEAEPDVAEYAFRLADTFNAEVHLLSVTEAPQQRDQLRTDHQEEVERMLTDIAQRGSDRLTVHEHVRKGVAEEEIITAVRELNADLIVMGTQGRTGFDKLLLGSVAESVIEESPVPVLTVTPEAELPGWQSTQPT